MFFDSLMNGLGLGAIFAFIALGYTMVYGIIKLINFAHGEFFMVGAFVGYFCLRDLDVERIALPQPLPILLDFFVALCAASIAAGLLAVLTERVAYRPVRKAGRIAALLTAVGVSLLLQNVALRVWSATPRPFPDPRIYREIDSLEGTAQANLYAERLVTPETGEPRIDTQRVATRGATLDAATRAQLTSEGYSEVYEVVTISKETMQKFVVLALLLWAPVLWFLVKRTRMGKAMRAASEDADAARLMGININLVVAVTFFIGAFVAGAGGVAYIAAYGKAEPMLGFMPGLKAFVAAVIGGIGSIPGAILGGMILGVTEVVLPYLFQEMGWSEAGAWKDAIAFAFLIVVLVVKPTGILGKPLREKV